MRLLQEIQRLLGSNESGVLVTVLAGSDSVGSKILVVGSRLVAGTLGDTELDTAVVTQANVFLESREDTRAVKLSEFAQSVTSRDEITVLFERIEPEPRLVICGAGHVGAALTKLGSFLGYRVMLIDDRVEFLNHERFLDEKVELVLAENWTDAVRDSLGNGKGLAVAIVTRGHNQDEECLRAVMGVTPDYVGLIGSKRRTNIVIERLRQSGVADADLKTIRAPIGLDIGAVTPEEVALAIIAEIVAERRGGHGNSLSAWRRSQA
ncbi:MAG: XdhC family protein [Pyrinomonadaceae bacterium]